MIHQEAGNTEVIFLLFLYMKKQIRTKIVFLHSPLFSSYFKNKGNSKKKLQTSYAHHGFTSLTCPLLGPSAEEQMCLGGTGLWVEPLIFPFLRVFFPFQNFTVPAGDMLMLSPYWLHRNPKYFPDPEMFKPVSCDSYWEYFAVFSPLISQQKHKDKLAFRLVIRYRLEGGLVCTKRSSL